MTERFVSPSGSGSTYSRVSPGHCAGAIAASSGDDIITALAGTYTGANYMLTITSKSGTSGHPITFRADVDGTVLIDGESSRCPMNLTGSSWWVFEGFDCARSDVDSVIYLQATTPHDNTTGSNHNILRRIGAYDAADINSSIILIYSSANNLIEDFFGFGTARKIAQCFDRANDNTFRRFWGQWTFSTWGSGHTAPKSTISLSYDSSGNRLENGITTWDQDGGADTADPYGLTTLNQYDRFNTDGIPANHDTDSIFDGCIGYQFSTQSGEFNGALQGGQAAIGITYNNCATYIETTSGTESLVDLSSDFGGTGSPVAGYHTLTNITAIRTGGASSIITGDWIVTNRVSGTSVASVYGAQSLYVNDGTKGATILYRTVDGVLQTGTSLWPWPMTQRIVDALTEAGRTVRNVDEDIQAIFGVPPTIIPGSSAPVDNFNTYTIGADLAGDNAGTNWVGAWATDGGAAMTTETAPSGFSGKTVKSIGAGSVTYYYRQCQGVSSDSFKWAMMSTVANPNDDFCGVSLHESGVNIRTQVQFSSGGNIRAYDYDAVAWVDVIAGFSANVRYQLELAVDTTNHPDQYRVRVNSGTWTAWLGVNGSLSVLNLFQINNFTSNATLWLDDIGSTGSGSLTNPVLAYTSLTQGVLTT